MQSLDKKELTVFAFAQPDYRVHLKELIQSDGRKWILIIEESIYWTQAGLECEGVVVPGEAPLATDRILVFVVTLQTQVARHPRRCGSRESATFRP